ncbi:MAG: DUF1801 domain-containing protein [Planctomycetes bacterium]|nr:DUF1801 domain-containing protein [Planctomycetota bacterium]
MEDHEVRELLRGQPPEIGRLVSAAREVVCATVPGAAESRLWGGLSYHRPDVGGRVKGAVCQISYKGGRVRLEFIHGVRLADPAGLLRGSDRVSKRFISIATPEAARRPEVAALIRRAAALDPTKWPVSPPAPGRSRRARGARPTLPPPRRTRDVRVS